MRCLIELLTTGAVVRHRLCVAALLISAASLAGCGYPQFNIDAEPQRLTLFAGETGTVTVTARIAGDCVVYLDPENDDPDFCVDLTGQVLDYLVQGLPPGVTHNVDTSLRSPSTPGVVRITFEAGASAAPGRYDVAIHATVARRSVGTAVLSLRILSPAETTAPPALTAIAAGGEHSLALLADGTLRAWGANAEGQLGVGDRAYGEVPAVVDVPIGLTTVDAGWAHTLARGADGTVWAWGDNLFGQLGDGTRDDRTTPVRLAGLSDVEAIAAGRMYSLALRADGTVWAWGENEQGALGDGTRDDRRTPVQVASLSDVQAIAAGDSHSLALRTDGTVWAWGYNGFGQLGDGGTERRTSPVQVSGLSDVEAIGAGSNHSLALRADGTVWSWGSNDLGQLGDLGDSVMDTRAVPAQVSGLSDVQAIAAGWNHSLALLTCNQLFAWGASHWGQLGDGSLGDSRSCARVALRVSLVGDGNGTVASSAGTCPNGTCVSDFDRGDSVTLTASPAADSSFDGWAIDCQAAEAVTSVVLDRTKHCAARFRIDTPELFLLSVELNGSGVVTSSDGGELGPERIVCGDTCQAIFPQNSGVMLSASAADRFEFSRWGGDCTGTAPETSVVMDARHNCIAEFRAFTVAASVTGEGRVTSQPAGLDCGGSGQTCIYSPGAGTAILTATPAPGWRFDGWGGDCTGAELQRTVAMDADKACTATFSRIPDMFFLTLIVEGEGSVSSVPGGIDCPGTCQALFSRRTVNLTALETEQSEILGWFDDCAAPAGPTNQVLVDADKTCRIRFATVRLFPVATFSFPPGIFAVGEAITFDGSASHVFDPVSGSQDPGGITSFSWDFDNDGVSEVSGPRSSAAVVEYTYQTQGTYSVRLRVRGGPFDLFDDSVQQLIVLPPDSQPFTVAVNISNQGGSSNDRVFSTPAGIGTPADIDCLAGTDPFANTGVCQAGFTVPQVQLTAAPGAGDVFDQWGGVCAEQGAVCVIDNPGNGGTITVGAAFRPGVEACITTLTQTVFGPFLWHVQADASCSSGSITQYRWWADFNFAGQLPTYVTTTPIPPEFEYEGTGTFDIRLEVVDGVGNSHAITVPFTVAP